MEKLEKRGFEFHIHHWPNGYDLYSLLILYLYLYELHLSVALSMCVSCSVVSDSLRHHGLWPAKLLYPWNSPGKNTEVGCHYLLQGIHPDPGIEPMSPALHADSLPSKQPGKPYLYLYKWYLSVLVLCLVIFLCFCIRLFKNYHIETFCKHPVLWGIIFKLFCCSRPAGTGLCCVPFI